MLVREAQTQKEDPRIVRTRKLLVVALNELMREKSFESITIGQITERATLNRVTFYAHFADKYALLEYSMHIMIQSQLEEQLGAQSSLSEAALQKLILVVCSVLADVEGHCPAPRGRMESLMEKQIKQEVYELLLGWLSTSKARRAATQPTPEQAAMVTAWAIYGAAFQWSQQAKSQPVAEFVRQVLPLIQSNLAPYFEKAMASGGRIAAGRAPSTFLNPVFRLHPHAV